MEDMLAHSRTKRFDIPLGHIDFDYIEKCTNVKEIERMLRILRSGEEGVYPDLEKLAESRLKELDPNSYLLRKATPVSSLKDIDKEERNILHADLKNWTSNMKSMDDSLKNTASVEADESSLPPVRGESLITGKEELNQSKKNKRLAPRDYKEWDKIDVDEELEKIDKEETRETGKASKASFKNLDPKVDTTGLNEDEKFRKATREKDKGNEAFHACDYEESIKYYSRSISVLSQPASFNNRALAYIKLSQWDYALGDLKKVLKEEPNNVKALLRTGTAYKGKKQYGEAKKCFKKVLQLEPVNKRAEQLIAELEKEEKKYKGEKEERKEKGHRMKIEDVSDDDETEEKQNEVNGWQETKPASDTNKTVRGNRGFVKENGVSGGDGLIEESLNSVNNTNTKDIWQSDDVDDESESSTSTSVTPASPASSPMEDTQSSVTSSDTSQTPPEFTKPEQEITSLSFADTKLGVGDNKNPGIADENPGFGDKSPGDCDKNSVVGDKNRGIGNVGEGSSSINSQESANSAPWFHARPVIYQYPFPLKCDKLREEGNVLFRAGQYAEAGDKYEQAIKAFGKDCEETVMGLSIVYSNLSACNFKIGNCSAAIENATKALELVPHSVKPLLRRAAAFESVERYRPAYVDFKHILSIDSSVQQAHIGSSRCHHALKHQYGSTWREKIPPLVQVNSWEIPQILMVGPDGKKPPVPSPVLPARVQPSEPQLAQAQPTPSKGTSVHSEAPAQETVLSAAQPDTTQCTDAHSTGTDSSSVAEGSSIESDTADSCVECPDPDGCFQQLKSQGNDLVQKSNFKEAVDCYTKCIDIFPDRAVGYTNRALCHLRLNQALEALDDCVKALELEPQNTKALYRKAQAKKMLHLYKASLQDLFTLLKLEPNNVAAKKEVEIVKKYYKEELEKVKCQSAKSTPPKKDEKQRKRMNIVEVDDDDDDEEEIKGSNKPDMKKHVPSKTSTTDTATKQSRVGSTENKSTTKGNQPTTSPVTSAADPSSRKSKHKPKSARATGTGLPVAPPSVPKLEKASPYEFMQAWNALKSSQGNQPYAELLKQVSPDELPRVISKHFDGTMLQRVTSCVKNEFIKKNDYDQGYSILFHLCKVARFGTVSMFMSKAEKNEMKEVLNNLSRHRSEIYSESDVDNLREKYSIK